MTDSSNVFARVINRLRPQPISVALQPLAIALVVLSVAASTSFVMPEGIVLIAITAIAVAYRWRFLVLVQVMAVLFLSGLSDYPDRLTPLSVSGGAFFPGIMLPILTAQWSIHANQQVQQSGQQRVAGWDLLLNTTLLAAALFLLTVLSLSIANAAVPLRLNFALYPYGMRLVALVGLMLLTYASARLLLGYFILIEKDARQNRQYIHQTLHKLARSEERLLFRKRRNHRHAKL